MLSSRPRCFARNFAQLLQPINQTQVTSNSRRRQSLAIVGLRDHYRNNLIRASRQHKGRPLTLNNGRRDRNNRQAQTSYLITLRLQIIIVRTLHNTRPRIMSQLISSTYLGNQLRHNKRNLVQIGHTTSGGNRHQISSFLLTMDR